MIAGAFPTEVRNTAEVRPVPGTHGRGRTLDLHVLRTVGVLCSRDSDLFQKPNDPFHARDINFVPVIRGTVVVAVSSGKQVQYRNLLAVKGAVIAGTEPFRLE